MRSCNPHNMLDAVILRRFYSSEVPILQSTAPMYDLVHNKLVGLLEDRWRR